MKFELTVLGSNSALPKVNRLSSAQVLNVSERFFLIDCGEGTQIQLRRYKIKFSKINHIFISHLHGDHIYGLPGLISSFNLLGRKADLHIYAHSKLEEVLNFVLNNLEGNLNYKIVYHYTNSKEKTLIYEDKLLTVESFPLKHKIQTTGFLFKEKKQLPTLKKEVLDEYKVPISERYGIKQGNDFVTSDGAIVENSVFLKPSRMPRSYAYCSDTQYYDKVVEYVKGVDLLYHEATFLEPLKLRAKQTMHSTAKDAAEIAKKAQVGTLLLGHYSSRYLNTVEHIKEAKPIFDNTLAVEDGFTFRIS